MDEYDWLDLLTSRDDDGNGQSGAGPEAAQADADSRPGDAAVGDPPGRPPALLQVADCEGAVIEFETLPGMSGYMDPLTDAQVRSETARQIFEAQNEAGPWMDDYFDLLAEGWSWRQAVYMLWDAQPPDRRNPRYQQDLAVQVLGLTSDRVISGWKADNPAMMTRIKSLQISALEKSRASIIDALVRSASNPNPRNHSDRKMALEMLGDYERRSALRVGPDIPDELESMSEEDLRALAYGGSGGGNG